MHLLRTILEDADNESLTRALSLCLVVIHYIFNTACFLLFSNDVLQCTKAYF